MECPVCMEYFQKPIYQCPTGHSICSFCKTKMTRCPYCAQPFSNTRNFALENILSTIKVACKNAKCTQRILLHNYSRHLDQCPYANVQCQLANCPWKGNKLFMNEHIKTTHGSLVVKKCEKLLSHQFTSCFIEHNSVFFYVHRCVDDNFVMWTAEPTIDVGVKAMFLRVEIRSAEGRCHIIKQPISDYLSDIKEMEEDSLAGVLRSKIRGCNFRLSIEQ